MPFRAARRRPHPALAVAVATTVAVTGAGVAMFTSEALAAPAPPSLELLASTDHQSFVRYQGESFYPYGLGLYARNGNQPLEIRTTRDRSYTKPVAASVWTGGTPSTKVADLPTGLTTDVNSLTGFFQQTITDSAGKTVSSKSLDFCPSSYEAARARPDAPPRSPYPTTCGRHPFALGAVLGIQSGWSVPAMSDYFYGSSDELDIPDGEYTVALKIKAPWLKALNIPAKTSSASLKFSLTTEPNPWGKQATGLEKAAAAASHHHADVPADTSLLSPVAAQRAAVLKRSWGTAEQPAAAPPKGVVGAAAARAVAGPRPDLQSLPADGMFLTDGDDFDPGTPPVEGKTYLSFNATIWNAGPSPLVVDGFRRKGTGLMDAYQYFFDAKGNQTGSAPAGTLEWDPREGHNHWHFTAFGTYRLLDATKTKAIRSDKEAFCLAATDPVDLTRKGVNYKPGSTDLSTACGGEGALSLREQLDAGWGDTYGQYLPGQSFDVTDVPNGTYYVEVRANPEGKLIESNSNNNVSLRKIVLGGKPGGTRTVKVPPVGLIDAP